MSKYQRVKICFLVVIAILLSLALLQVIISQYVAYNDTKSEPVGFYKLSNPQAIEISKLYTMEIPDKYYTIAQNLGYTGDGLFLKKVIAKSGDSVKITESGILINNKLLPTSKAQESVRGVDLDPQPNGYEYVLKDNEYWTYGEGANSFDSRYYGVITRSNIHDNATFWFNNKGVEEWQKQLHSLWQMQTN